MTMKENEMESLKHDILQLKGKLNSEKNARQTISIIPSKNIFYQDSDSNSKVESKRKMIASTKYNFKLSSVDVFDEYTNQYESKLVYINQYCSNPDFDERIRLQVQEEFGSDDDIDDYNYDDYDRAGVDQEVGESLLADIEDPSLSRFNDLLSTVRLDQLLKPITKPGDVIDIKSVQKIYKEKYLEKLSNDTIEIIEKEQENVNLLNQIMDVFLLEDPDHIKADNLGLASYNHHLDLDKEQNDNNNDNVNDNQDINIEDDPFFRPPIYESDPQFEGIDQEEIDETRQLIQIALQRNEEFVRSLTQIRYGFLHADNYREDVYNWCKEMHDNEIIKNQKEREKEREKELEMTKESEQ